MDFGLWKKVKKKMLGFLRSEDFSIVQKVESVGPAGGFKRGASTDQERRQLPQKFTSNTPS